MKGLLIGLNLLLAIIVLCSLGALFGAGTPEGGTLELGKKHEARTSEKSGDNFRSSAEPLSGAAAAAIILEENVFDLQRCPNAVMGRGSSNNTVKLLGICRAGALQGAIIQVPQVKQTNSNNRNMPGQNKSGSTSSTSKTSQIVPRQFFRVGEALPNGYTLTTLRTDSVVLTRGGSKMELTLAKPSENQSTSSKSSSNKSNGNVVTQAVQSMQKIAQQQQMQQMMMMRMMMQQNRNNSAGGTQTGNRSGNNSNSSSAGRSSGGSSSSGSRR